MIVQAKPDVLTLFKFLFDYDYVIFIKIFRNLALKIPVFMFWLIIIRFCDSVRNRFEIGCLYQSAFVEERILIRLGAKRFLLLTQIHPRLTMRLIQILLRCRDRLYPIENSRRCSGRGWQFWVSEGKREGIEGFNLYWIEWQ